MPSAFIPFSVPRIPENTGAIPVNASTGEWLGNMPMATRTFLRFELPAEVLPLHLATLRFRLDVRAPGRDVELLVLERGAIRTLASFQGPISPVEVEVAGDQCPQPDEHGHLSIGFSVSNLSDLTRKWDVRDARINVAGDTISAASAATAPAGGTEAPK